VDGTETGFYVEGDGTALVEVAGTNGERLALAGRNDARVKTFRTPGPSHRIDVRPSEVRARLTYENGTVERVEIHDGSGYFAQSSRTLWVPSTVVQVTLTSREEAQRTVRP
jgi:hypothetical protein